jgi:hypothetical protein
LRPLADVADVMRKIWSNFAGWQNGNKNRLERLLSFLHSRRFADVRNQYFEPQGACIKLLKQRQEHGKNTCYSAPWSSDKQDLSLYSQLQLFMNTDIAAMYQFLPISM